MPCINGFGASGSIAADGAYASHRISFENNHIHRCGIGFNFDTGSVRYIRIQNNLFSDVNMMGQLGTPTGSMLEGKPNPADPTFHYNFIIRNNVARLCRHYVRLSMDYPDAVKSAGLLKRNNSAGIVYQDNVLIPDFVNFARGEWDASDESVNYFRLICASSVDPYFDEYYGDFGPGCTCEDDANDGRNKGNIIIHGDLGMAFGNMIAGFEKHGACVSPLEKNRVIITK